MPSDLITVKMKVDGKYPKIQTEDGKSFGLSGINLANFDIGGTYTVNYTERPVQNPKTGKTFTARDITGVSAGATMPQKQAEKPQIQHENPEVKVALPVGIPIREMLMARECALKCSVEMAKAWTELIKGRMDQDLDLTELTKKQEEYYKNFISVITCGEKEIPF